MDPVREIAAGGEPAWRQTFTHPEHGELEFVVREMPKTRDWLAHAVAQEALGPGLGGSVNAALAAAVAGMQTFVEVPVLSEEREEDPDNPDHIRIRQVRYDPLDDENFDFPILVWATFMNWRGDLFSRREDLKNSSGVTSTASADDSSPASTESPQQS